MRKQRHTGIIRRIVGWLFFASWRLVAWEVAFPIFLLFWHQLLLQFWVPNVGFLDRWSVSTTVLYGDSLLAVAMVTHAGLVRACQLHLGYVPQPDSGWRRMCGLVSLGLAYLLVLRLCARTPDNTQHLLAWAYDVPHLVLGTVVIDRLLRTVWLCRRLWRQERLRGLAGLVMGISLVLVMSYVAIGRSHPPAIRFSTGWQPHNELVLELQHTLQPKLFTQPEAQGGS